MSPAYFLFYVEANIVCIAIFGILLHHDIVSNNRQEKQIRFDLTISAHILYFISDIFWAGVLSGNLARTRFSVALLNYTNYVLLGAIAYEWFTFCASSENMPRYQTRRGRMLIRLPYIISCVVMAASYLLHPQYWISENTSLNSLYFPLMLAAPLFYVLWSFFNSMKEARKTDNPETRHIYRLIGVYPMILVLCGILQLFNAAPLFCFGCTIMMLFFYIQTMDGQISIDPLTRLNNRNQLYRYIAQENNRHSTDKKTFVMMVDANDFKIINDTYGHTEGDQALIMIANSLRSAVEKTHLSTFLGRFGGDEFILVVHCEREEDLEHLAYEIRRRLEDGCAEKNLPYRLSVGVGYDELQPAHDTFEQCMRRADKKLYLDKEREKKRLAEGRPIR